VFRLLQNLALMLGSVMITLVAAEFILRPIVPVFELGPVFTTYSNDLGLANKASLRCERITPEYHNRVTTNQFGLRGRETTLCKPAGTTRILCLGDSFTFGKGVEGNETFCSRLEELVNRGAHTQRFETLNAGVVSYGTSNELIYLRKRGFLFDPDVILLQFHPNDFDDNLENGLFRLDAGGKLILTSRPYANLKRAIEIYQWIPFKGYLDYSHLFQFVRIELNKMILWPSHGSLTPRGDGGNGAANPNREVPAIEVGDFPEYRLRLTGTLLSELFNESSRRGRRLVLITFDLAGREKETVAKAAKQTGTPILDFGDLKTQHPEFYYPVDQHWKANAHEYVAQQIARYLKAGFPLAPHDAARASGKFAIEKVPGDGCDSAGSIAQTK
jgi:hypothetical protein